MAHAEDGLPGFREEDSPDRNVAAPTGVMASPLPAVDAEADPSARNGGWTPQQLVRLEHERRLIQRSFAYHPYIRITPLQGDPPDEYQVEYRVNTIALNEDGQWTPVDTCTMQFKLPINYPHGEPVIFPLTGVFHPNVSSEGVWGLPEWAPTKTLTDRVQQIGTMLAYRWYDAESACNGDALSWVQDNFDSLPTDTDADFGPNVGGEPLARLCAGGPATLRKIRKSFEDLCDLLLTETPPEPDEIRRFIGTNRLVLVVFLETDLPQEIRNPASDLDEWIRVLPETLSNWDVLRREHHATVAAEQETPEAMRVHVSLEDHCNKIEKLLAAPLPEDIRAALDAVPSTSIVRPAYETLSELLFRAQHRIELLKTRLVQMEGLKPGATDGRSLLHERMTNDYQRIEQHAVVVRKAASTAVATMEPMVARAKILLAGLRRVVDWRAYTDILAKIAALRNRLTGRDPATIQAVYIDNGSGAVGPFDFEQPVTLGSITIAVRSPRIRVVEVLDAAEGTLLGFAEDGRVTVEFGNEETGDVYAYTFLLTERTGELRIKFEGLIWRSLEALARLVDPIDGGASWCGGFTAVLAKPETQEMIAQGQKTLEESSTAAGEELRTLGRFKERLATYNLIKRYAELLPPLAMDLLKARTVVREAMTRIVWIMSRCIKEEQTGRDVIPAQYGKEYAELVKKRDKAQRDIDHWQMQINNAVAMISHRLGAQKLWGAGYVPESSMLGPIPQPIVDQAGEYSDEQLFDQILRLEESLNVSLRPPGWAGAAMEGSPESAEQPVDEDEQIVAEGFPSVEDQSAAAGFDEMYSSQESAPAEETADWPTEDSDQVA